MSNYALYTFADMQSHHFLSEPDDLENPQWTWTCQTDLGPKTFWGRLIDWVNGQGSGRAKSSWGLVKICYLLSKCTAFSLLIAFGECSWVSGTPPRPADEHVGWCGQEGGLQGQDGAIGRESSISFLPNFISPKQVSRGCPRLGPVQYRGGCLGLQSYNHTDVDIVLLSCYYTGFGHWVFGTAAEDKRYDPFLSEAARNLFA